MWQVIREYPRAVVYAVLMHVVLLILLMFSLDWTPKISQPSANRPIQAKLVDQRQLDAVKQKKEDEQRRIRTEAEKQRQAEIAVKQKAAAEKKRKADALIKKAAAEKKRKADALKKAAAEKERKVEAAAKQKAEAKRKVEAKQKSEAERKAAAVKQKAAAAEKRKAAEAALQAQMAAEHEQRVSGVVAEYTAYIQVKVNRNWLRPLGIPEGLSCTVKVILIPGGDVANVEIIKSSGNPVFDRSVEAAVFKAAPMPLPPDSSLFNYFRDLRFIFTPGS